MTPTNACLDAATLAAWVDGGLSRPDAAMAEAHVSSCPRCQEIAGLIVKTGPLTPVDAPGWRARLAWLVPATAAVAAAGLWMIAPTAPTVATVAPPAATSERGAPQPEPRQDLTQDKALAGRSQAEARAKDEAPRLRAETPEEKRRDARANAAADVAGAPARSAGAAAPAASPAAQSAAAAGRVATAEQTQRAFAPAAARQAVSPDGALQWRVTDRGVLERSTDGGTAWEAVNVGITATFATIQAPEPRTAIVTTTDGRQFRTTDAGATWQPVSK